MSKERYRNIFTPYNERFDSAYFSKFYELIKDAEFNSIDADIKEYLDSIVNRFKDIMIYRASRGERFSTMSPLLNTTVKQIYSSENHIGLENADQMAYVLINIVDSNLEYLKRYVSSYKNYGDNSGVITYCGFCEPRFALLEQKYNNVFHVLEELVNDNEEKTRSK